MILGDAVLKLETFVWISTSLSRSITWPLFTLKASYLVKWPISTWSFMWWCQFIDLFSLCQFIDLFRPSSLMNFRTANLTGKTNSSRWLDWACPLHRLPNGSEVECLVTSPIDIGREDLGKNCRSQASGKLFLPWNLLIENHLSLFCEPSKSLYTSFFFWKGVL